jgi:zinc transport system permease protein
MLSDWIELGFLRRALGAGLLTAAACGLLSPYVVLRRMAFAGHGLSHAAFGGAALALWLSMPLTLGGALFACMLAGVLAVWTRRRAIEEDSAIGILVAASMALGVVLLSLRKSYTQDVFGFLFGNILAVLPSDLWVSLAVTAVTTATLFALRGGLVASTFHEELARVEGVRVDALRLLLFLLVALNVVAAMKLVGAVLVSALLVIPGSMALLVARRFPGVQTASLVIGLGAVVGGLELSYRLDLPSGAVIALVLFGAYGVLRAAHSLAAKWTREEPG